MSFPAIPAGIIFAIKLLTIIAKLKPDYIEWVLKLNSSQAQDEYHKLEKANRELK